MGEQKTLASIEDEIKRLQMQLKDLNPDATTMPVPNPENTPPSNLPHPIASASSGGKTFRSEGEDANSSFDFGDMNGKGREMEEEGEDGSAENVGRSMRAESGSGSVLRGSQSIMFESGDVEWKAKDRLIIFVKKLQRWCKGRVIRVHRPGERTKLDVVFSFHKEGQRKHARVTVSAHDSRIRKMTKIVTLPGDASPDLTSGANSNKENKSTPSDTPTRRKSDIICANWTLRTPPGKTPPKPTLEVRVVASIEAEREFIYGPDSDLYRKRRRYKILVVGNSKCGKTSIINRFVNGAFSEDYRYTIGCDYSTKDIRDPSTGITTRLQLWDIAGQDRFIQMNRPFFRNAVGAIVVCDVARKASIDAACLWKTELERCLSPEEVGFRVPTILIANKVDTLSDVHQSFVIGAYVQKTALKKKFDGWFIGSAKRDENINEAISFLIQAIEKEQEAGNESTSRRKISPLKTYTQSCPTSRRNSFLSPVTSTIRLDGGSARIDLTEVYGNQQNCSML